MAIEFDNDRDRFAHGYDAGTIVDGFVTEQNGRHVLVDDDGVGFDPGRVLELLTGKRVRMTIITFDAMDQMEDMLKK